MDPYRAFWMVFGATVGLLVVDLATGLAGRRRAHLAAVALTLVGLGASVWLALRVGATLDFQPTIHRVHRVFATGVVVLLAPMAATGAAILARKRVARAVHRRTAYVLLVVALCATVTGIAMERSAVPKGAPPAAGGDDMLPSAGPASATAGRTP